MKKYIVKTYEVTTCEHLSPEDAFECLIFEINQAQEIGYKLSEISGSTYDMVKDKQHRLISIQITDDYK